MNDRWRLLVMSLMLVDIAACKVPGLDAPEPARIEELSPAGIKNILRAWQGEKANGLRIERIQTTSRYSETVTLYVSTFSDGDGKNARTWSKSSAEAIFLKDDGWRLVRFTIGDVAHACMLDCTYWANLDVTEPKAP